MLSFLRGGPPFSLSRNHYRPFWAACPAFWAAKRPAGRAGGAHFFIFARLSGQVPFAAQLLHLGQLKSCPRLAGQHPPPVAFGGKAGGFVQHKAAGNGGPLAHKGHADVRRLLHRAVCRQAVIGFLQKVAGLFGGVPFGGGQKAVPVQLAQGEEGQQVEICCGEETVENEPYTARHLMRCNCNYREVCTLSGGRDELEFFDYKAFRYVNVNTDRDNLDSETFCVMARHNQFEEKCELRSNVPWLEEIWKLCVNSLKWGTQEDFLDCPSREKGLYLGDFTVSGLAYLYVTGNAAIYKKTLLDFASTTKICPGMMAVASGSLMQEIADFSLQYPLQVLNYYYYTGDRTTVEELYPVICGIMDYFKAYEREDGLLEHVDEKWNLVDWPDGLRDGYTLPGKEQERRPLHNVLNAHYIGALLTVQKLQRILGLPTSDHVETCKRNFIKTFYDPQTKLFCDMPDKVHSALHSNVLPAFYGFAPEEAKPYIRECILRKGLCCGTQFSYFVLKALGKVGTKEDQIKLLLNEGEHSWVNMLREGATTTFEAWGKEQKSNTSLCHPWSCAPVILIVEDILQKNPTELGRSEKTILQWNAQSERIV